jgi:ubiquinone/menaquinone biosynthesis C-methylase UbiE
MTSSDAGPDKDIKTAKLWDRFAAGYAKGSIDDVESYQTKLKVTQDRYLKSYMKVVEIGCGTGGTSILHAPRVQHILATDVSSKMLEFAQQNAKEAGIRNVEFRQASVDQLELPAQSQDVVLALSILHLLPNRPEAFKKVHNWLKPGGVFVTSTICLGGSAANSFLVRRAMSLGTWCGFIPEVDTGLTRAQLSEEMKQAGFDIDYEWQPNPKAAVFLVGRRKKNES